MLVMQSLQAANGVEISFANQYLEIIERESFQSRRKRKKNRAFIKKIYSTLLLRSLHL